MFKTIRFVFGVVVIFVIALACLRLVLGDNFHAWLNGVRSEIRNPLEEVVGKYQVKFEKAKIKVEDAKEKAKEIRVLVRQQRVAVAALEKKIVAGRSSILERKQELGLIKEKVTNGTPVYFVSGSKARADELREHVERRGQEIEIAEEKLRLVDPILRVRRKKLSQLESFEKSAPSSVRRMTAGLNLLKTKLEMYQDVKGLYDTEANEQMSMDGLFAEASKALEDAHYELDYKLAEFDAMVDMSIDLTDELESVSYGDESVESLIDEIMNEKEGSELAGN